MPSVVRPFRVEALELACLCLASPGGRLGRCLEASERQRRRAARGVMRRWREMGWRWAVVVGVVVAGARVERASCRLPKAAGRWAIQYAGGKYWSKYCWG